MERGREPHRMPKLGTFFVVVVYSIFPNSLLMCGSKNMVWPRSFGLIRIYVLPIAYLNSPIILLHIIVR